MKTRKQLVQEFWGIADILRGWVPSDVAAECPAGLFFLKRLTDLASTNRLDAIAIGHPERLVKQFDGFSWAQFAKEGNASEALLWLLEDIEKSIPELDGLSTRTKLAQILTGRGDINSQLRTIFTALDAIPTNEIAAEEVSAVFQELLDVMADRAASSVTPRSVRGLLVGLLAPKSGESIYDPACGYASLLRDAATSAGPSSSQIKLSGQELNLGTMVLARMNLILGGWTADLRIGDTLVSPQHKAGSVLQKFDVILANPPFGLRLGSDDVANDKFERFIPVPPSSSELAFVQHVVSSLTPHGRAAIMVPNGILFRAGNDYKVRRHLVETGRISAVVSLPPHLFPGTAIPVTVLMLRGENDSDGAKQITFLDLSAYAEGPTTRRHLTERGITAAGNIVRSPIFEESFSCSVSQSEVATADFNLSVSRYVRASRADGVLSFADEMGAFAVAIKKRNSAEADAVKLTAAVQAARMRTRDSQKKEL